VLLLQAGQCHFEPDGFEHHPLQLAGVRGVRHIEWLNVLRQINRETPPENALHLICDDYATHTPPKVKEWLATHPRFHVGFTPTSASWLNMVEQLFHDITTQRLGNSVFRSVFRSVPESTAAIKDYIAVPNKNPSLSSGPPRLTTSSPR